MTVQRFIRKMQKYLRRCRRGTNYTNNFRISCVKFVYPYTVCECHYPKRKHKPLRTQRPLFASQPSTTACRSIQVRVRVLTTWAMRTSTPFTYYVMPKLQTRQSLYRTINVTSLTEVCSLVSKIAF